MRLRYASTRAEPLLHWACLPYSLTSAPQSAPAQRPVGVGQPDSPTPFLGILSRAHVVGVTERWARCFRRNCKSDVSASDAKSLYHLYLFTMVMGVLEGGGFQYTHTVNPTASSGSSAARCPGSVRGARLSKVASTDLPIQRKRNIQSRCSRKP